MTDIVVALSILAAAALPLGHSISSERMLARSSYERAVAMEIVDGEMEVLAAGAWKQFPPGTHQITPSAEALRSLPEGRFELLVSTNLIRLTWEPAEKHHGGAVVREVAIR